MNKHQIVCFCFYFWGLLLWGGCLEKDNQLIANPRSLSAHPRKRLAARFWVPLQAPSTRRDLGGQGALDSLGPTPALPSTPAMPSMSAMPGLMLDHGNQGVGGLGNGSRSNNEEDDGKDDAAMGPADFSFLKAL